MRILICGFGVVGQGLARLLRDDRARLLERHGLEPVIVGAVDSRGAIADPSGLDPSALLDAKSESGCVAGRSGLALSVDGIGRWIAECDADVLVQAVPSVVNAPEPAILQLRAAFGSGKHAVTVTKAPLAVAMPALLELAAYNGVIFGFSGTVGAGTPIIALAERCALGDRITRLEGILNGTTNYILSAMAERGETLDQALAEAQRLGYAETDPSADIDGVDTACKIVILANRVMGRRAAFADVRVEGIRSVGVDRIRAAAQAGKVVKLVGRVDDDGLIVAPVEVPVGGALDVPGTANAVRISLARGGEVTLTGRGAGSFETASAIVRDLIDIWHATHDTPPRRMREGR